MDGEFFCPSFFLTHFQIRADLDEKLSDFPTGKKPGQILLYLPGMQAPCHRDVPHHKS